jgi:peptidoglycan/LPS O-acetylase OafA/YrhL
MFVGNIWSLAVEEQFYLTFPEILVSASKRWRTITILGYVPAFVL